jgi:tetratricopeptide (TPR) repeat protein
MVTMDSNFPKKVNECRMNSRRREGVPMRTQKFIIICMCILTLFLFNLKLFPVDKIADLEEKLHRLTGKERFDVLHELSFLTYKKSPRKSIKYAEEATEIAKKLGNKIDYTRAVRNIGLGHSVLGDLSKALNYYYKALELAGKLKQTRLMAVASLSIAAVYYKLCYLKKAFEYNEYAAGIGRRIGEDNILLAGLNAQANILKRWGKYSTALKNYFAILRIKEKKNLRSRLGVTYHNMALVYIEIKDYDAALELLEKALTINREFNNPRSIARNLNAVGDIYYLQNRLPKASETYTEAKTILLEKCIKPDLAEITVSLGRVAFKQNRLDEALRLYKEAFDIANENNYPYEKCSALISHGEILKFKGEYREALDRFLQAMEIAENSNMKKERMDCYLNISETYSQLGDSQKSYEYFKKHAAAKDEIFNPLVSKEIRDLQLKYEKDKIALAIQDIKKSRTWILLAALLLTAVSIVFFFSRYRMKIKARELLYEKEKELAARDDRIKALTEELKKHLETKDRKKYERSTLSETQAAQYLESLLAYMEEEEAYLDPDLTIKELSEQLSIPARDLSQVINERLNQNFNDFVNHYRIEKAKELLLKKCSDSTILDVAFDSGFNSKSSFNTLFKKFTKYTPSQYKKTFGKYRTGTFPVIKVA